MQGFFNSFVIDDRKAFESFECQSWEMAFFVLDTEYAVPFPVSFLK